MRGTFKLRPSLPRYNSCFDAGHVIRYLQSMEPIDKISLEELSLKLVMIYCLLTAHRDQTLAKLTVTNTELTESKCTFYVSQLLKTSRPGNHLAPLELKKYVSSSVNKAILGTHGTFERPLYPAFYKFQSSTQTGDYTNLVKMLLESSQAGEH